ncbi:hypothetical protein BpHYR1_021835 [Brachionus plicatilis]|uniref:Uncharacterized protein n=1 Tax=Brachionus plicatilis TaxID=10195 RepID=A0A3M7T3X7_BRAPC|nr:hypothetical protein BpHYR1_021835 [Brachionus plicatilis]
MVLDMKILGGKIFQIIAHIVLDLLNRRKSDIVVFVPGLILILGWRWRRQRRLRRIGGRLERVDMFVVWRRLLIRNGSRNNGARLIRRHQFTTNGRNYHVTIEQRITIVRRYVRRAKRPPRHCHRLVQQFAQQLRPYPKSSTIAAPSNSRARLVHYPVILKQTKTFEQLIGNQNRMGRRVVSQSRAKRRVQRHI